MQVELDFLQRFIHNKTVKLLEQIERSLLWSAALQQQQRQLKSLDFENAPQPRTFDRDVSEPYCAGHALLATWFAWTRAWSALKNKVVWDIPRAGLWIPRSKVWLCFAHGRPGSVQVRFFDIIGLGPLQEVPVFGLDGSCRKWFLLHFSAGGGQTGSVPMSVPGKRLLWFCLFSRFLENGSNPEFSYHCHITWRPPPFRASVWASCYVV